MHEPGNLGMLPPVGMVSSRRGCSALPVVLEYGHYWGVAKW
jgi:hypothetical protein